MRLAIVVAVTACSSSSPPAPAPSPPAPVVATADASPPADELAPLPYTAAQLRAACPVGRVIPLRIEVPGKPATISVFEFVASDETGAEIATTERDAQGRPVGQPQRQRSTWDDLRQHAAFPRAATVITDGTADTPAGRFPSKIYTVTRGDEVSKFYFATQLAGPPVLFTTDKAGARVMTSTLLDKVPPEPVACTTDDDCWLDGRTPIARPAKLRRKKLRPCRDAEAIPACKEQVCVAIAYKC